MLNTCNCSQLVTKQNFFQTLFATCLLIHCLKQPNKRATKTKKNNKLILLKSFHCFLSLTFFYVKNLFCLNLHSFFPFVFWFSLYFHQSKHANKEKYLETHTIFIKHQNSIAPSTKKKKHTSHNKHLSNKSYNIKYN